MPTASAAVAAPELSVVIASVNGPDLLDATLRSLDALPDRRAIEVVVVAHAGDGIRERLEARDPSVVVVEAEGRRPIPRLRYLGVRRASGPIVAILEDHVEVAPDWSASIREAHDGPCGAVGGVVENGRAGLVNWAAFFTEYTAYMGPVPEGPHHDLPGNNIAYKRPHLWKHAGELDAGRWESWINDRLRADGVELRSSNRMVVRHIKPFPLGTFLTQRFHFGRSFAGMRRVDQSWLERVIYGLGSAALPAILLARIGLRVLRKGRHLGRFAACLPLIVLFLGVGALGEMLGYLVGPGRSLERVE
jgi:hypothetical protein